MLGSGASYGCTAPFFLAPAARGQDEGLLSAFVRQFSKSVAILPEPYEEVGAVTLVDRLTHQWKVVRGQICPASTVKQSRKSSSTT